MAGTDRGNTEIKTSRAGEAMISDYRDYFTLIGNGRWECRLCGVSLSYNSRERHLERVHLIEAPIQNSHKSEWTRPDRKKFIEAYNRIEYHRCNLEAEA